MHNRLILEPRIQYVASSDGTQIAYTSFGEGSPLVFPANAWGDIGTYTAEDSRSALAEMLDSGFQVVLYDGRGAGSSDRGISDMSLTARLADLEAVIDRLDFERFGLMGVVHGCSAAVAYAAEHPECITRMVLYGPYVRGAEYFSGTPATRAIRALWDMAADNWEFFTLTLANWMLLFADPIQAARIATLYRNAMNAGDYLTLMEACEATDISGLLEQVKTPTLVVRDPGSPFTDSPESTRQVASMIRGAQSITVDASDDAAGMATALAFLRGEASLPARFPGHGQRRGVVTVLFTDLVGHTEMMRRLGDEKGRDVLREHERITRDVLKTHGGTEVKTMGDGFMASFASVTRAVECAIALQRAFAERNVDGAEALNVRVGLNSGEPIADDGDLFGSSVILASRIAAKAEGGKIFASLAVRELCSGKGFLFADLGEHELRGFEDPVKIFEVKWKE